MEILPRALEHLTSEYLPLKEIMDLGFPITHAMLQEHVRYDPKTLTGGDLTEDQLDSLMASVLLNDIPPEFIDNPDIYESLPYYLQRLIIERLLPRYTPDMVVELVYKLPLNTVSDDPDYTKMVELLGWRVLSRHFRAVYAEIFLVAMYQGLSDISNAILADPDFVPSTENLEYAINHNKEDLAINFVERLYDNGGFFEDEALIQFILDSGMVGLIDRVISTHLNSECMELILTQAVTDPALMEVVLKNPTVRPMVVVNFLESTPVTRATFDLVRAHPRMHTIRPVYWDIITIKE